MRQLLFILSLFIGVSASAQQYNNEWIDYNKTYYKFKVGVTGLYRIPQSTLAAAGIGNSDVKQFQLWRNGVQVPLYTSVQTGVFPADGYIEFWGEANDGKADLDLYRNANDQINNSKSLFTDTAAYFLTVDASANNRRFTSVANTIPTGVGAERYFTFTAEINPNETIHLGPYEGGFSDPAISASYEGGEGWTSKDIIGGTAKSYSLSNLFPYKASDAPDMQVAINLVGNNSTINRMIDIQLNNAQLFTTSLNGCNYVKLNKTVSVSGLTGTTENFKINAAPDTSVNRYKVASIQLTYPRAFNFGGASNFRFQLPASASLGKYLEISGFNYSGTPVLYDLENDLRYEANTATPSTLKIFVQPGGKRDLVLVNEAAANIKTVSALEVRKFTNYLAPENQGDYLIITHSAILTGANGSQPVEDYRAYRSSAVGGSYKAKICMIDQLIDQFAFGIKYDPLSLRNFARYARNKFSSPVKNIFLIGRGVKYTASRYNESSANMQLLNLIPSFGEPASDVLLTAEGGSSVPLIPIGRLSVVNGEELSIYLDKVKQYETLFTPSASVDESAWKKNVIHMIGANDDNTTNLLYSYLNQQKPILMDTSWGANVQDFVKNTSASEESASEKLRTAINNGVGLLTYFGHSAANALAFNLDNPANYNNQSKYPVFNMMGCNVGDIFIWDANRLASYNTISERYLFSKNRGSIAMMAGTGFGFPYQLQLYNRELYKLLSVTDYSSGIGDLMKNAVKNTFQTAGSELSITQRAQNEEYVLNGDPAIKFYQFDKPDYAIESDMVSINPAFVSIAEKSFRVDVKMLNLGKAINKNLVIELKRTYPNLTTQVIKRDTIQGVRYADSLSFNIPIDPLKDKGQNKITVTIDPDNSIEELFKTNNSVVKEVYIYEDEVRPVYPYDYSIVNKSSITFKASTADALSSSKTYLFEIDTTALFNSRLKVSQTKTSIGGVVDFNPSVSFKDSTVYYWRVAAAPNEGEETRWNNASFFYKNGSQTGFSQSDYYQMLDNQYSNMKLDSDRKYKFDLDKVDLSVSTNTFKNGALVAEWELAVNGLQLQSGLQSTQTWKNSLRFYIVDNITITPWKNKDLGSSGSYGSYRPLPWATYDSGNDDFFTFDISTLQARQTVMKFIDSIPDGAYIIMTNSIQTSTVLPSVWQSDTTSLGSGNSLYHKLMQMGFTSLDSMKSFVPFILIGQKGNSTPLNQAIGSTRVELVKTNNIVEAYGSTGSIQTPIIGPAKEWKALKWIGENMENPDFDNPSVDIIGVQSNGTEDKLREGIKPTSSEIDISSIDAKKYPKLMLNLRNVDSTNRTPYQLNYWRVYYTPAPEGAIAPNAFIQMKDTLDAGEPMDVGIAFKNISDYTFDSIKVKLTVKDKNNRSTIITLPKLKPLSPNDTIKLQLPISTASFSGANQLYIEFNPDNDQPEQYQFNNFLYKNFYVRSDSLNPYMDVTFDGLHILNKDIVSSKPNILITLTDNAKYLLLNNKDLAKVQLRYPDGTIRNFQFNNDTLVLTAPGQGGNDETTATINFKPYLTQDGEYELMVNGKDQSGNPAGKIDYRVAFQVINKPMISNLLNYPNPFTTSTAFVFTLTGSEIPQNIRIQILTITGKIVREITKAELGSIHIGRNITEYKWDGTDQYGQKLANGVYLYRVLTNLNGKSLDKYKASGDNTDKYFNKGYGKMVLIR